MQQGQALGMRALQNGYVVPTETADIIRGSRRWCLLVMMTAGTGCGFSGVRGCLSQERGEQSPSQKKVDRRL